MESLQERNATGRKGNGRAGTARTEIATEQQEQTTKYTDLFIQRVGRAPTSRDIAALSSKVPARKVITYDEEAAMGRGKLGNDGTFDTLMAQYQSMSGATDEDIRLAMGNFADEERAIHRRKEKSREWWTTFWRRGAIGALCAVIAGAGIGTISGLSRATDRAFYDTAVQNRQTLLEQEFKKKEEDLKASLAGEKTRVAKDKEALNNAKAAFESEREATHRRFYGSLDTLAGNTLTTTLTPLERELYFTSVFGNNAKDGENVYEGKLSSGIKVVARRNGCGFTIFRLDGKDGILSASVYSIRSGDLEKALANAKPTKAIIFTGDEARQFNYENNSVQITKGANVVYKGSGTQVDFSKEWAGKTLTEFIDLHARGTTPEIK